MSGAALPPGTIIDITRPVSADLPVWPGDPPVVIEPVARIEAGDPAAVSRLALGTHTGTHVDPPAHFLPGAATVDALPLEVLVGPAVVVEVPPAAGPVDARRLAGLVIPVGTERLLFKSEGDAAGTGGPLTAEGARWLVERGIRLVGADTLSIERPTGDYPVHRTLLGAGIVIVEGLDLSAVPAGRYRLVCLPLRIAGGDGAPARAVLITEGGDR
jgi:arylformamidase